MGGGNIPESCVGTPVLGLLRLVWEYQRLYLSALCIGVRPGRRIMDLSAVPPAAAALE